jgi:hypothetical protein
MTGIASRFGAFFVTTIGISFPVLLSAALALIFLIEVLQELHSSCLIIYIYQILHYQGGSQYLTRTLILVLRTPWFISFYYFRFTSELLPNSCTIFGYRA